MGARILVTGSRNWTDEATIEQALEDARRRLVGLGPVTLVHGGCPTGADVIADRTWRAWGLPVEVHPADWERYGRRAGPIRNQHMVDLGADLVLAFPLGDSRGTRGCIAAAMRAGMDVRIISL